MTFGNRILELRAHAGLSQEAFAERLDTTRQTVSRWELDLALPEIEKIVRIARLFGVTTDSLLLDGISTFDDGFEAFPCGVYRGRDLLIVETERFALVYADRGDRLASELYEGFGREKTLRATVSFDLTAGKAVYAYADDAGKVVSASDFAGELGKPFDRSPLDGMKRVGTFFVDRGGRELPTVGQAGFKTCLETWRKGTRFYCREGNLFASVWTGGREYAFHMNPSNNGNIYCCAVPFQPFAMGVCTGQSAFRIRNWKDNTDAFACSFAHLNDPFPSIPVPDGRDGLAYATPPGVTVEYVTRYTEDSVTVSNCGDELTYFRNDPDMVEYFV